MLKPTRALLLQLDGLALRLCNRDMLTVTQSSKTNKNKTKRKTKL